MISTVVSPERSLRTEPPLGWASGPTPFGSAAFTLATKENVLGVGLL